MAHVMAELVDENTLEVDGVRFVRENDDEVLIRPIYGFTEGSNSFSPKMQCSSCGYTAGYWQWFHLTGFRKRYVRHCPGCGMKIAGVMGRNE